jgi:hypothetical protein
MALLPKAAALGFPAAAAEQGENQGPAPQQQHSRKTETKGSDTY